MATGKKNRLRRSIPSAEFGCQRFFSNFCGFNRIFQLRDKSSGLLKKCNSERYPKGMDGSVEMGKRIGHRESGIDLPAPNQSDPFDLKSHRAWLLRAGGRNPYPGPGLKCLCWHPRSPSPSRFTGILSKSSRRGGPISENRPNGSTAFDFRKDGLFIRRSYGLSRFGFFDGWRLFPK